MIHRFIISDITTSEVLDLAVAYEALIPRISAAVKEIEDRQVASGIGMTIDLDLGNEVTAELVSEAIARKHGDLAKILENEALRDAR